MIAEHQVDRRRDARAPLGHGPAHAERQCRRVVNQVAEYEKPLRARFLKRERQARQIVRHSAIGEGHTVGPKTLRLAQMQVGDDEHLLTRPIQRPIAPQHESLTARLHLDRR